MQGFKTAPDGQAGPCHCAPRRIPCVEEEKMIINLVYVWVKEGQGPAFIAACRENVSASRLEPGVAAFDVIRQADDPSRFVLIEAFRDETGPAAHKETVHYKKWRETVAPMMREDRKSLKCTDIDFFR